MVECFVLRENLFSFHPIRITISSACNYVVQFHYSYFYSYLIPLSYYGHFEAENALKFISSYTHNPFGEALDMCLLKTLYQIDFIDA